MMITLLQSHGTKKYIFHKTGMNDAGQRKELLVLVADPNRPLQNK